MSGDTDSRRRVFGESRVIPVITLPDADLAVPVARALVAGGLPAFEVALRTPAALEAIARIKDTTPDAVPGAGTVLDAAQAEQAITAGAEFLVSPGSPEAVSRLAREADVPFIPGTATPTEVMRAMALGLDLVKVFPAGALGGPAYLRALAGPFPQVRYLPTGGVNAANLRDYLALPQVWAVAGTWLVTSADLAAGDWEGIERRARDAARLAQGARGVSS
ncbi:MAG: bifunctional 4-hydroxy-2-oxoglutarate aldolase/2-dehydro-3-deoxy-phosphogluconate aldolase [Bifidobacteriaceae bacterium]|jgi:2-dehydro-3-deoxyphosphogluconate aldolase/(4S)-4-hydroxy-2-oxoglutarate aldolase|nr:bifunctional 4-hydroxy-2-oxoglutarate aldolase/2-dehydro-3-deoxy-phosphogluconate aldolase [Bifidobacteriaceae bacterium]